MIILIFKRSVKSHGIFLVSGERQPWQGYLLLGLVFPCTRPDLLNRSNRPR